MGWLLQNKNKLFNVLSVYIARFQHYGESLLILFWLKYQIIEKRDFICITGYKESNRNSPRCKVDYIGLIHSLIEFWYFQLPWEKMKQKREMFIFSLTLYFFFKIKQRNYSQKEINSTTIVFFSSFSMLNRMPYFQAFF